MPEKNHPLPFWMLIAIAGGFGGTAPNIFRVGTNLTAGAPLPEVSYLIGVLVFFLMGGGVALAFQEVDAKKAFFLGLSLPAMFQSSVADISTARAAMLPPAIEVSEEPPRVVQIEYNATAPRFSFIFSGEDDDERGRAEELLRSRAKKLKLGKDDGRDVIEIPSWAVSFQILVIEDRQLSAHYEVWPESEWEVEIAERRLRGLKQSIGIKDAERWRISVGKKESEK